MGQGFRKDRDLRAAARGTEYPPLGVPNLLRDGSKPEGPRRRCGSVHASRVPLSRDAPQRLPVVLPTLVQFLHVGASGCLDTLRLFLLCSHTRE
jgi:hypothetical protein